MRASSLLRLVDSVAVALSQAYQAARVRLASAASPVLRLLLQRDQAITEAELLRRECAILRFQRQQTPSHRRPDYAPEQRLAILQLMRLREWTVATTARRFMLHPNTVRSWINAVEGSGNTKLLTGAVVWNRMDDAVRWAAQEIRRLCPEPEFGTRTIARHLVRAGIAISRSTVQRIMREKPPAGPAKPHKPAMPEPVGLEPDHLLKPKHVNQVWHLDLTHIRVLWFSFTLAAILDGFSRKLLALKVYATVPRTRDMARLARDTTREQGRPRFLITDHGTQFGKRFQTYLAALDVTQVRGRVRAPYLDGKLERAFRTFRIWWRLVLVALSRRHIQCRVDAYRFWYNQHRPSSALGGLTPEEAWVGERLPPVKSYRACDASKYGFNVRRLRCEGDPRLPVI